MYSAPNTPDTHVIAEKVFLYHLETTAFCPKVSWETFVDSYKLYMKHGTRNYVDIGFADFIFSYVDSTDFSVIFNSKIYDCEYVYKTLKHIFDIEY